MNAFWDELHKLGWVEGANLVAYRKEAFARVDQLPALAAELFLGWLVRRRGSQLA